MAQTNQNGARAKILRALIINGMLTTEELAQQTGLPAGQARDNANIYVLPAQLASRSNFWFCVVMGRLLR